MDIDTGNMNRDTPNHVWTGIAIAAVLWLVMFSPWTSPGLNFWYAMSASAAVLIAVSTLFRRGWTDDFRPTPLRVAVGIAIAAVLWGVFWVGDVVSQWLFSFAGGQVDSIYAMKDDTSPAVIALLLLLLIGPAEEIFWRGFVQRSLMLRWGPDAGFLATTAVYALVHVWSGNFMLVMAALVVGFCWGLIYRLRPDSFTSLVVSHAVWDACAFVLFPFH